MSNSAFQPSILTVTQASSSGSGQGEVNVVTNPSAATDLTKWTATGFTAARATSGSPLDPVVPTGFVLTPQAIGNTFTSEALTVPSTLRNRKLKLEFYYTQASAAWKVDVLNSSDTRFTLTTDSSAVSAIPASASGGKFVTYFDMDSGSTVKVRFTSTAASGAISVTQVIVGPGIQPQGAVVGEWVAYPTAPTWGNVTLGSGSTVSTYYRRVGTTMEIDATLILGTGGDVTGVISLPLPSGFTRDSAALSNANATVGTFFAIDANTGNRYPGTVYLNNSTSVVFQTDAVAATMTTTTPFDWTDSDSIRARFSVPIAEWAGSGTVQLAQNDVEFASNNSTWDSDVNNTTAFVYGPAGNQFGGALTLGRIKRVRFQTPIQADSVLVIEGSDDRTTWFPLANAQIGGVQISASRSSSGTGDSSSGVYYRTVPNSNTDIDVFFFRYAALANDDTPASDWPATGYWRVRKTSAGAAVGFGIVQPGVSSGLVSASGLPGNTTGNVIAQGYVGEQVEATISNYTVTTSEGDVTGASLPLSAGIWEIKYAVSYNVTTGTAVNNTTQGIVKITDSGNTTIARTIQSLYIKNTGTGNSTPLDVISTLSASCVVRPTGTTTYKLRALRVDLSGTGSAAINNNSNYTSLFYAIRLA